MKDLKGCAIKLGDQELLKAFGKKANELGYRWVDNGDKFVPSESYTDCFDYIVVMDISSKSCIDYGTSREIGDYNLLTLEDFKQSSEMRLDEFLSLGLKLETGDVVLYHLENKELVMGQPSVNEWNESRVPADIYTVVKSKQLDEYRAKQDESETEELPQDQREELDRVAKLVFELIKGFNYIAFNDSGYLYFTNKKMKANCDCWDYSESIGMLSFNSIKTTFNYKKYWHLSQMKRPVEYVEGDCYKLTPKNKGDCASYGEFAYGAFYRTGYTDDGRISVSDAEKHYDITRMVEESE